MKCRCGRNDCFGCFGMKGFEKAQMVYEDALLDQPSYAITLTTRDPVWNAERWRRAKEHALEALRSEFGRVECLGFIEQTTGEHARDGKRRGHEHNLFKGLPPGRTLEIERIIVPVWKRWLGSWQVNVAELQSAGGAVAYLTLNWGLEKAKARQLPDGLPAKTRTFRPTRGYWSMPSAQLRAIAKETNARKRLRHALERELQVSDGPVGTELLDLAVEYERARQLDVTWELWRVREKPGSSIFEPVEPVKRKQEEIDYV